jgi:hypothetical protein
MSVIEKRVNRTISISAVITRADGTVEDLGVIYSEGTIFQKIFQFIQKFIGKGV